MRPIIAAALAAVLSGAAEAQPMWVSAYYTGWRQARMPPSEIDFDAITHLVHFSVVPRPDGSLDARANRLTPENVKAAVDAAHAAKKKILFTVGGQGSRDRFVAAMADGRRKAFVSNLVAFMKDNGYDGIDVDMEDIRPKDRKDYSRFIRELRAKLDGVSPRPLLTAAVLWEPELFARLAGEFDQINLMTYNLAGPYNGWVVWHSGALYDGGMRFPDGRSALPSVDGYAEKFAAAGAPRSKLGVGLSFNGYVWSGSGVSKPGQGWEDPPMIRSLPYYELARAYALTEEGGGGGRGYKWDPQAQAPYLSVGGAGADDAEFVSFDNGAAAARRAQYVRAKGLGGMIVWDIAAGWRAELPEGERDPLLQAVKRARLAPTGSKGGAR
jgi:chitinase